MDGVPNSVTYVLTNLVLLRVTATAQEPIEERLILLRHSKSPSLSSPTPVFYRACDYSNCELLSFSASQTADTYTHVSPTMHREAAMIPT